GLGGIEGQKADQLAGMAGGVSCDLAIGDPQSGKFRLPAEHDGSVARSSAGLVVLPADGEVHLDVTARPLGLVFEIVGEMLGILPVVAVNVDQGHPGRITEERQICSTSDYLG